MYITLMRKKNAFESDTWIPYLRAFMHNSREQIA